jgi:hypothetical protein
MTFNADAHGHLLTQDDDRFDELWSDLKARMRGARGEREAIRTYGEDSLTQQYGARVQVWEAEEDDDGKPEATIGIGMRNSSRHFAVNREDLINIAAHCLGAVADMDELNNEKR